MRELIENDKAESYSAGPTRRTEGKEWDGGYRLEKRPRQEETNVDWKLQRMKEQLLAELGAKDNN